MSAYQRNKSTDDGRCQKVVVTHKYDQHISTAAANKQCLMEEQQMDTSHVVCLNTKIESESVPIANIYN